MERNKRLSLGFWIIAFLQTCGGRIFHFSAYNKWLLLFHTHNGHSVGPFLKALSLRFGSPPRRLLSHPNGRRKANRVSLHRSLSVLRPASKRLMSSRSGGRKHGMNGWRREGQEGWRYRPNQPLLLRSEELKSEKEHCCRTSPLRFKTSLCELFGWLSKKRWGKSRLLVMPCLAGDAKEI